LSSNIVTFERDQLQELGFNSFWHFQTCYFSSSIQIHWFLKLSEIL